MDTRLRGYDESVCGGRCAGMTSVWGWDAMCVYDEEHKCRGRRMRPLNKYIVYKMITVQPVNLRFHYYLFHNNIFRLRSSHPE